MGDKNIVLVERTMEILEYVSGERRQVSLAEISENLHIPKPTAYRIVDTLKSMGYILQDENSKKYFIAYKILELANDTIHYNDQINKLKPYMKLYAYKYNLSSSILGYTEDNKVIFIYGVSVNPKNISQMTIGATLPYYISVAGKNMLAELSDKEIDEYLEKEVLLPYTEYTITNKEDLKNDILLARKRGYSICNREFSELTTMLGIPIYDSSGKLSLTLSLILSHEKKKDFINDKKLVKELLNVISGFRLD